MKKKSGNKIPLKKLSDNAKDAGSRIGKRIGKELKSIG